MADDVEITVNDTKYRLHNGEIQILLSYGGWSKSAWDNLPVSALDTMKKAAPMRPLLEAKYGDDPNGR